MLKYFCGFLLILSFSSCKDLTEVETTGTVRDATNQAPLDSVKVSLFEDNDDPFMGNHLLQETVTDGNGRFRFDFTYKEGPYKIFVTRRGYRYTRTEFNKVLNISASFEYQEVAPLDEKQILDFDMDPQVFLKLKIKNTAPAQANDLLKVEVGKGSANNPAFLREFAGIIDQEVPVGNVDANKFTPILVSIYENSTWRTYNDSVYVAKDRPGIYFLNY